MAHLPMLDEDDSRYNESVEDARSLTTDNDLISLILNQSESTESSEEKFGSFEEITSLENNFPVISGNTEQNRKNVTSDKMAPHENDDGRLRAEIFGTIDQIISTLNKQPGILPDSGMDISIATSSSEMNKNLYTDMNPDFLYNEESHSHNQEMKTPSNITSANIVKKNKSSNSNIPQNEIGEGKITDSSSIQGKNLFSFDENFAVPGPSRSHHNFPYSNLCVNELQKRSPLKNQTATEPKKITLFCSICKREYANHFNEYRHPWFKCCKCGEKFDSEDGLLLHAKKCIFPPFFCPVCKDNYEKMDEHQSDKVCNVCDERFQCKNQLEDHYLNNEDHQIFCWICPKTIDDHNISNERKDFYECCQCKRVIPHRSKFRNHLNKYIDLRLHKCKACGYRFVHKSDLTSHLRRQYECQIYS